MPGKTGTKFPIGLKKFGSVASTKCPDIIGQLAKGDRLCFSTPKDINYSEFSIATQRDKASIMTVHGRKEYEILGIN